MEKDTNIIVLEKKDLTKDIQKVNKEDIRQYFEKDYINQCIEDIRNPQHRMLMQTLWFSGMRITEVVNLTKGNIDFPNYTMRIRWQKSRKYNERIVPMHPKLRDLLLLFSAAKNLPDKVFPISRQRAWQLTQKYFDGHPHQIRHSFAVNWLRSGGDIVTLHRMLGHSKIQTTMEYLKIVPQDVGKELLKINFD